MESVTRAQVNNEMSAAIPAAPSEPQFVDSCTVDSTSPTLTVSDIPSKWVPYPEGSSITYRPYSYGELELIGGANSLKEKAMLCLEGVETRGFHKKDMDYQDFIYVMTLRKLSSFSTSKFTLKVTCPHCGNYMVTSPEINKIEFSELDKVPTLPCVVDVDGTDMHFAPLTISQVLDLDLDEEAGDSMTVKLSRMCQNIHQERAKELIQGCNGETMQVLDYLHSLLDFGKQTIDIKCVQRDCAKTISITLRGVAKLAEPFRASEDVIRNRIVFGSK